MIDNEWLSTHLRNGEFSGLVRIYLHRTNKIRFMGNATNAVWITLKKSTTDWKRLWDAVSTKGNRGDRGGPWFYNRFKGIKNSLINTGWPWVAIGIDRRDARGARETFRAVEVAYMFHMPTASVRGIPFSNLWAAAYFAVMFDERDRGYVNFDTGVKVFDQDGTHPHVEAEFTPMCISGHYSMISRAIENKRFQLIPSILTVAVGKLTPWDALQPLDGQPSCSSRNDYCDEWSGDYSGGDYCDCGSWYCDSHSHNVRSCENPLCDMLICNSISCTRYTSQFCSAECFEEYYEKDKPIEDKPRKSIFYIDEEA